MVFGKIVKGCFKLSAYIQLICTNIYWKRLFSNIGSHTVITGRHRIRGHEYIQIGDNCWFGDSLRLEAISQYAGKKYTPRLVIEDKVCINQNFHCTCAEEVVIGKGTSITANCGVFDIIHPYKNILENPREAVIETKPVTIGKDCLIGMNSVILPGTKIGNHCVIGANSVVSGDYPNYCVIAGAPAKIVRIYDHENKKWERLKE